MERFAVIGLGRFGMRLAIALADAGAEVIAVDRSREIVEEIRDRVTLAVCMDATDEQALRAQGIDKVDAAIVGIGTNFEESVLSTAILKQIGVPRVISRAGTTIRGQILSRVGADDIVSPERESAERWRNRLLAPAVLERLVLAEGYSLVQVQAPPSFHDQTLGDLAVGTRYKVLVVAIRRTVEETDAAGASRPRQTLLSAPGPDSVIKSGDVLVLIGADAAIEAFPTK
jgi:trk system potassium uptake protein TrkA